MSLTTKEIKEILEILEASGWDEATVTVGEVTVTVSKNGPGTLAPAPLPVSVQTPAPTIPTIPAEVLPPSSNGGHMIKSSTVGVFWRAPEPGAPPFVDVGTVVHPGEQLCIVEVMKLMTPVHADLAGTVTAIHVTNGEKVECGTPLITIEPA